MILNARAEKGSSSIARESLRSASQSTEPLTLELSGTAVINNRVQKWLNTLVLESDPQNREEDRERLYPCGCSLRVVSSGSCLRGRLPSTSSSCRRLFRASFAVLVSLVSRVSGMSTYSISDRGLRLPDDAFILTDQHTLQVCFRTDWQLHNQSGGTRRSSSSVDSSDRNRRPYGPSC